LRCNFVDISSRQVEGPEVRQLKVVWHWGRLFPPRDKSRQPLAEAQPGRLLGRFFSASRERLRDAAERSGLRQVPTLGGCPAP